MATEQAIERGRAIQDLVKMEGWTVLKSEIEKEIAQAVETMRQIEVSGRPLADIGAEFVEQQKLIDGLNRTLEIVQELLGELESATTEN